MALSSSSNAQLGVELQHWKALLPKAPDADRPSGVVPIEAYPAMVVGGIVAVPFPVLAATLVSVINRAPRLRAHRRSSDPSLRNPPKPSSPRSPSMARRTQPSPFTRSSKVP